MSADRPPLSMRDQVILFTIVRLVMNIASRMIYPFLAVFARGMGVELTQITLALTVRQLSGVLIPFLSPLADRRGRKFSLLLGLGMFILAAGAVALRPVYGVFFAATALGFLGVFTYVPAMQAYLGDHIAYHQRGQSLAMTELSWALSFIIGMPLVGLLINRLGWQSPYAVVALLALGGFGLVAWLVPAGKPTAAGRESTWQSFRRLLAHPSALAMLALSASFTSANEVINVVFGVWMEGQFGLKVAALGAAAAVIGVAELAAELLTALLVDRLGKRRSTMIGVLANALVALMLPWMGAQLWSALIGLGLFFLTFEFAIVSSLPMASEVMPESRATLLGFNITAFAIGRALGSGLAPFLFTWGLPANAAAAVVFNLFALLALSRIHVAEKRPEPVGLE